MYKADLYIIAAGAGSRMGGSVPKPLIPLLNDEPNISTMLSRIGHKFENIFLVTSLKVQDYWQAYLNDPRYAHLLFNVKNIPIVSGLGDGHAVLSAFKAVTDLGVKHNDDIVICWGDVFFKHHEIIDEMFKTPAIYGLIPAIKESNPYVTLLVDDKLNCLSADFSKHGESHSSGFHDQSVFAFAKNHLQQALNNLHVAFWKNGRYMTPGGELSLLHSFHYLYNIGTPAQVYETDYPTMSFNTPGEVNLIVKEISENG